MKLLSLTASNYRIHAATSVQFDPALTLIGGPNESGKSTLVEALYNALFMRSRKSGYELDKMKSRLGGDPEVTVSFEQNSKTYTIKKIFRGTTGRSSLDSADGTVHLEGDEAEKKLFALLGIEEQENAHALPQQWAHLWVRQGESSTSPTATAAERQHQLFDLLQRGISPAASLVQSAEDARLARQFDDLVNSLFNKNGSPKANTAISQASALHKESSGRQQEAMQKCKSLEEAAISLELAHADHKEAMRILAETKAELIEVEAKLQQVIQLRMQMTLRTANCNAQEVKLNSLLSADQEIRQKEQEMAAEIAAAAPLTQALTDATSAEQLARTGHLLHGRAHQGLAATRLAAENLRDLYSKSVVHLRLEDEIVRHRTLVAEAMAIRNDISAKEQEIASFRKVSANDIAQLQKLETAVTRAKAAFDAIATRMEIVQSSHPIVIEGQELQIGESIIFSEGTEILIGRVATIRITPGGGTNLQDARVALSKAEDDFSDRLRSLGVLGVAEARTAQERRSLFETEVQGLQNRLTGLGEPERTLTVKEGELTILESEFQQQYLTTPGFQRPDDLQVATQLLQASEEKYTSAKEDEVTSSAQLHVLAVDLEGTSTKVTETNNAAQALQQRQTSLSARIAQRIQDNGDLGTRTVKLAELRQQVDGAKQELQATSSQLNILQPDLLNDRKERLQSASASESTRRESSFQTGAEARAKLTNAGDTDPRQTLVVALAQESATLRRLQEKQCHGDAIKLLSKLYAEEQDALNTRLTGPLENKVSAYLQCIFGPGSAAFIPVKDRNLSQFLLSRDGVTFDFSMLSGGTKEQVAIAFRLAMAEVLAANHGGSLPIILDDAFTNSDGDRIRKLRDMLYRATRNGLQVIVFSCNPGDYQGHGGKTVTLTPQLTSKQQPTLAGGALLVANQGTTPTPTQDFESNQEDEEQSDLASADNNSEGEPGGYESLEITHAQRDEFLAALREMPEHSSGNTALRKHLCWDEQLYNAVKDALILEGKLQAGRGKGGSVSLIS